MNKRETQEVQPPLTARNPEIQNIIVQMHEKTLKNYLDLIQKYVILLDIDKNVYINSLYPDIMQTMSQGKQLQIL